MISRQYNNSHTPQTLTTSYVNNYFPCKEWFLVHLWHSKSIVQHQLRVIQRPVIQVHLGEIVIFVGNYCSWKLLFLWEIIFYMTTPVACYPTARNSGTPAPPFLLAPGPWRQGAGLCHPVRPCLIAHSCGSCTCLPTVPMYKGRSHLQGNYFVHRKLFCKWEIIIARLCRKLLVYVCPRYQWGDGAVIRTVDWDAAGVEHHARQQKLGVRVRLCLEHLGEIVELVGHYCFRRKLLLRLL